MRNFFKVAAGLDTWPLLHQLQVQPELWNQYPVRTQPGSNHAAADDILLRYNKFDSGDDLFEQVLCNIDCVDYPAWNKLPAAQNFVYVLMRQVLGIHLGRVMIARLKPGAIIQPHSDLIPNYSGAQVADYYERYHIVLQSNPGVQFLCGNDKETEAVYMAPGEIWWFNNALEHSVINNSPEDRIHLIADIRVAHDDYVPA